MLPAPAQDGATSAGSSTSAPARKRLAGLAAGSPSEIDLDFGRADAHPGDVRRFGERRRFNADAVTTLALQA